jgi:hypothetical protein
MVNPNAIVPAGAPALPGALKSAPQLTTQQHRRQIIDLLTGRLPYSGPYSQTLTAESRYGLTTSSDAGCPVVKRGVSNANGVATAGRW